ncbi:MFS transporter [Nocardia sp. NPDC049149]|uniref:MFS transporter n=1 Tax=Nocardia sp. NPDC049149 TaxID=3364315 RepID=UPI00371D2519
MQQLWILDSYGFMVGGLLITMGAFGDRIGRRKLLMIGAACFAAACLVSAFATDATTLIAGRALLGVAGSTLAPSTLALIRNMFREPNQRGLAIGVWAASFPLGAILGSVVGGVVLAHFWWGSAFLLAVPVMVLLLALCPLTIDEYRNPDGGAIDIVSALLSVGAMVAVSYGLKEIARHGAQATPILVGLCGIGCGIAFVRRQRRRDKPFMDLRLFENRAFSTMLVGLVLYALIGTSSMFYLTQYLQSVLGLTPFAGDLGALLAAAARESFTAGMNVVAAICVVILLVAAVIVVALLRQVLAGDRGSDPAAQGTVGQPTPSSSGTT